MFIAIVGTRFSGKSTAKDYLVNFKGFRPVKLGSVAGAHEYDLPPSAVMDGHPRYYASNITLKRSPISQAFRPESFLLLNSPVSTSFPDQSQEQPSSSSEGIELTFGSPSDLLEYVTKHWKDDFVTLDLDTWELIERFQIRPFFMVVNVDAPILTRYHRGLRSGSGATLEEFVRENDLFFYGSIGSTSKNKKNSPPTISNVQVTTPSISRLVNLHVLNAFDDVPALHSYLEELDITNPERLRPGWDTYFMQLASLASHRSNCMKRRVGAILVRNNRILSTGYNGTPRGLKNCNEGGCNRCNSAAEVSDECVCLHAEENALLEAGRDRIGDGSVLYCNTCPCLKCTIKIIQTGVKEVVYNLSYRVDDASAELFQEAGVILRRHAPPASP